MLLCQKKVHNNVENKYKGQMEQLNGMPLVLALEVEKMSVQSIKFTKLLQMMSVHSYCLCIHLIYYFKN